MIGSFHNWIRALVTASVIASLSRQITPLGPVRKVVGFICGIMLLCVLLSPVLQADLGVLADVSADYRATVVKLTEDLETQEKQLLRTYIQQQTSAYILDEAKRMGGEGLRVEVLARWGDESWVPYEVTVTGPVTPELRTRLSDLLRNELGIPAERQHWRES